MKQTKSCNDELKLYLGGRHDKRMLVIEPNDVLIYVDIDGDDTTLEELQRLVGGYIEVYPSDNDKYYYLVDEEGLLKRRPFNKPAYELLGIEAVGPVVLVPKEYFH